LSYPADRRELEKFLATRGLSLDSDVDYAVALHDKGVVVGVGALSGYVLKDIAVAEGSEGSGVASTLVSHLLAEEMRRGIAHIFVFTRPESENVFASFGFSAVERVEGRVVLLENRQGLASYLKELAAERVPEGEVASVVVNCNPFTLGHRYLIETAAAACDRLHVFVVDEDRSLFPAAVRYGLVKAGVSDLPNVSVHHGGKYIISSATFPSYFLREPSSIVDTHARLDAAIFGRRIAPALGISRRFIGEEPLDEVTGTYNCVMKEMLPAAGVEVTEIKRLEKDGVVISASTVRRAIKEDDMELVRSLVPRTTYEFLVSDEAQDIRRRIASSTSRH